MKNNLPPFNSLLAFEAAARHMNFSKAAKEMNITQGAISKQIKIIEDYFGKNLFDRLGNNLKITPDGQEYYKHISLAFDGIKSATESLKRNDENKLTIHSFASFYTYWLIHKIKNFQKQNPHIKINLGTSFGDNVDINKMDYDVVIWGYKNSFKNAPSQKLLDEVVMLVCSPSLIKTPIKKIADLLKYQFLENNYRPEFIKHFIKLYRLDPNLVKTNYNFDYLHMVIEAAKQGIGIGFVPEIMAKDFIKTGILINPLDIKFKTRMEYHAVYPKKNSSNKNIEKFSKWLISELNKSN